MILALSSGLSDGLAPQPQTAEGQGSRRKSTRSSNALVVQPLLTLPPAIECGEDVSKNNLALHEIGIDGGNGLLGCTRCCFSRAPKPTGLQRCAQRQTHCTLSLVVVASLKGSSPSTFRNTDALAIVIFGSVHQQRTQQIRRQRPGSLGLGLICVPQRFCHSGEISFGSSCRNYARSCSQITGLADLSSFHGG
jgi:hypothetical protein